MLLSETSCFEESNYGAVQLVSMHGSGLFSGGGFLVESEFPAGGFIGRERGILTVSFQTFQPSETGNLSIYRFY